MNATTSKKSSLTVTARKGQYVATETLTNDNQKRRWISLLEKNGFRVVTGKKI